MKNWKKVDYICTLYGERVGVSVTRAMSYPDPEQFSTDTAYRLLYKKLFGLVSHAFKFVCIDITVVVRECRVLVSFIRLSLLYHSALCIVVMTESTPFTRKKHIPCITDLYRSTK